MKQECIEACLNEIKQTIRTLEDVLGVDAAFPVTSRLMLAWEELRNMLTPPQDRPEQPKERA
jgi:hypothetical protein